MDTSAELAMSECLRKNGISKSWKDITQKPGSTWSDNEIKAVVNCLAEVDGDRLVKFAYSQLQSMANPYEEAKDVVQNAYERAFRFIRTYDPERYRGRKDPFLNWIYTIIAREARRRAEEAARCSNAERGMRLPEPREPGEEDVAINWEVIEHCLSLLPPPYQQAIRRYYKDGWSIDKIAAEAGCSVGAMKVRLHRARQMLRRLIKERRCRIPAGQDNNDHDEEER